jgi:hypothetical protein
VVLPMRATVATALDARARDLDQLDAGRRWARAASAEGEGRHRPPSSTSSPTSTRPGVPQAAAVVAGVALVTARPGTGRARVGGTALTPTALIAAEPRSRSGWTTWAAAVANKGSRTSIQSEFPGSTTHTPRRREPAAGQGGGELVRAVAPGTP